MKKNIFFVVALVIINLLVTADLVCKEHNVALDVSYFAPNKNFDPSVFVGLEYFKPVDKISLFGNLNIFYSRAAETDTFTIGTMDSEIVKSSRTVVYLPVIGGFRFTVPYDYKKVQPYFGAGLGLGLALVNSYQAEIYDYDKMVVARPEVNEWLAYYGFNWQLSLGAEYTVKPNIEVYAKALYNGAYLYKYNPPKKAEEDENPTTIAPKPPKTTIDMSGMGVGVGVRIKLDLSSVLRKVK